MKSINLVLALCSLSLTSTAAPSQPFQEQLTFKSDQILNQADKIINKVIDKANDLIHEGIKVFEEVTTEGITHQLIKHDDFAGYAIRIKETNFSPVGESNLKSEEKHYAGYLDIDDEAHIFFTFHESRSNPKKDPVSVWLNGGPGCSSQTGELFELGPFNIADGGANITYNKHSWNSVANMIFIDSPTQVGFSYGSRSVSNSQDTARDLYAFLQLFYIKFPQFAENDFHIAGESYAGTYIPNVASFIHNSNLDLPTESSRIIPLKSVLIGNGLTDSKTQFGAMPDYACNEGKFKIFDEETCASMRSKVPQCQKLTQYCYDSPNRFVCVPATLSCWQIASPIQQSGLNPYDTRKKCDRDGEDGPLCYRQMEWIETRLNMPEIKKELGVSQDRTFASCNMKINQAFQFNGDVSHNTAALLPPLLESGIRVLIYAGEYDFLCNWSSNLAWTNVLEWSGQSNYTSAKFEDMTFGGKKSISGGSTKSVGEGAGLFTFLQVHDAGHMVPYDQPEFALDFFSKWIKNEPFV